MSTPYSPEPPIRPSVSESQHERSPDLDSSYSHSPLQTPPQRPAYPPPLPSQSYTTTESRRSRHIRLEEPDHDVSRSLRGYDAERAQTMPAPGDSNAGLYHSAQGSPNGSWDLLAGIRKFEHSYEEFKPSNASESHLAFAEGDVPKNRVRFHTLELLSHLTWLSCPPFEICVS